MDDYTHDSPYDYLEPEDIELMKITQDRYPVSARIIRLRSYIDQMIQLRSEAPKSKIAEYDAKIDIAQDELDTLEAM